MKLLISNRNQRGFTLIELLVVISIIGLLASVALASLATARQSARDATRLSDIKQIQNALELYRTANNGLYPTAINGNRVTDLAMLENYIKPLPTDPTYTGNRSYRYSEGPGNGSYTLLLMFENDRTNSTGEITSPGSFCRIIHSGTGRTGWTQPFCF